MTITKHPDSPFSDPRNTIMHSAFEDKQFQWIKQLAENLVLPSILTALSAVAFGASLMLSTASKTKIVTSSLFFFLLGISAGSLYRLQKQALNYATTAMQTLPNESMHGSLELEGSSSDDNEGGFLPSQYRYVGSGSLLLGPIFRILDMILGRVVNIG